MDGETEVQKIASMSQITSRMGAESRLVPELLCFTYQARAVLLTHVDLYLYRKACR